MQRGKKTTARKSTGGKAPRKQLVTMAERKEDETSDAESAQESSSSSEDESSEEERSVQSDLIPPEYQVPQGRCPQCGSVGILGQACETCQNRRNNYDPIPSSDEENAG